MPTRRNQAKPQKAALRKEAAAQNRGKGAAAKVDEITRQNEQRRASNEDNPGQGEAGNRHIDSATERDRGPIGVKGRGAAGQSKPGRR